MYAITGKSGLVAAQVLPWGVLRTAGDGLAIFSDPFDGTTLDTTVRWATPTVAGAGALAITGGLASLTVGTGASSAVQTSTKEKFVAAGSSFVLFATLIQFEAGSALTKLLPVNNNSFFGQGTQPGSYTAATPLQDAIGFERDITGKFRAVLYVAGTRTVVKDLTTSVLDGQPHAILVATRGDTKYFFLDDLEIPVASITYTSPANINLPLRIHSINHTSGPSVAPTLKFTGIHVIDSGSNAVPAFDGTTVSRARTPNVFINLNAVSVAAETTIWTPVSGRKFRLMGFVLTSGTVGGNVTLKDNTAGTTILTIPFGAAGATIVSPGMGNGILSAAANNVLTATGAATQTLSGFVFGTEE